MTPDVWVFLSCAAAAIALGLVFDRAHSRGRMKAPRECMFCHGIDGRHTEDCLIHQHRRPAA